MSVKNKELRFVAALVVFFLVCQLVVKANFVQLDPLATKRRTWTTWALDSFIHRGKTAPDVVFLGSSLMLTPLNMADAEALHAKFDGAIHHESNWFEAVVKDRTGCDISTFNFALPGEMPSDAYLIENLVLKDERKPKIIIYGVGPRDFMDNLLDSPAATDPYHWLSKLATRKETAEFCADSWDGLLSFAIGNVFLPSQLRLQMAENFAGASTSLIDSCIPSSLAAYAFTPRQMHQMLPTYHSMDVVVGECLFEPRIDNYAGRFVNNLDEYRSRYAHLNWDKFKAQVNFLSKTLALANERRIGLVLVVMPITSVNRSLIRQDAWLAYKNCLNDLAAAKNAKLIDLSDSAMFSDLDFGDTVHLNAMGGVKLLQELADQVVADPHLSETLGLKCNKSKFANQGATVL